MWTTRSNPFFDPVELIKTRGWTGALIVLLVVVGIVVLGMFGMRSNGAYALALAKAQSSPVALEKLGANIEAGFTVTGTTSSKQLGGGARLKIPVSGDKDEGTLEVHAKELDGEWELIDLHLMVGNDRFDLLSAAPHLPPLRKAH